MKRIYFFTAMFLFSCIGVTNLLVAGADLKSSASTQPMNSSVSAIIIAAQQTCQENVVNPVQPLASLTHRPSEDNLLNPGHRVSAVDPVLVAGSEPRVLPRNSSSNLQNLLSTASLSPRSPMRRQRSNDDYNGDFPWLARVNSTGFQTTLSSVCPQESNK